MSQYQIPLSKCGWNTVSEDLKITLYPHQVDLTKWMIEQEEDKRYIDGRIILGGLVADGMGLGKTKSTIACMTVHVLPRTLVICPKSVLYQWIRELIFQGHNVYLMNPDCAQLIKMDDSQQIEINNFKLDHLSLPGSFVGVTTFGMVKSSSESNSVPYPNIIWDRIIIDEAHTLRNGTSPVKKNLRFSRLCQLQSVQNGPKWALSGTPVQNRINDLTSIFLWIGFDVNKDTTSSQLKNYIRLKMFRRTPLNLHPLVREAIKFPTEKYTENKIVVEYSTQTERNFYLAAAGKLHDRISMLSTDQIMEAALTASEINEYSNSTTSLSDITCEDNILLLLNMLRFLSTHPSMYINIHNQRYNTKIPLWEGSLSKYDMIQKQLNDLYTNKESCLIFVHFYEEATQIADRAKKTGYTHIQFING
jgi:SNF2 family DNA or RNA helicase